MNAMHSNDVLTCENCPKKKKKNDDDRNKTAEKENKKKNRMRVSGGM